MNDAENHRDANDAYHGALSAPHVTCPQCGTDDVTDKCPDSRAEMHCNNCEHEWDEW